MDLEIILKKLESIEQRLERIENGCSKMEGHVDFVERAYKSGPQAPELFDGPPCGVSTIAATD